MCGTGKDRKGDLQEEKEADGGEGRWAFKVASG